MLLASSPGILLYLGAECLVTQHFFFKMADGKVCIKTKVTALPTVPTKRVEELTGNEASMLLVDCASKA